MGMCTLEPADHFYTPTNRPALRCYDFTTSNVFFTLIFVSVRDLKIEERKVHLDVRGKHVSEPASTSSVLEDGKTPNHAKPLTPSPSESKNLKSKILFNLGSSTGVPEAQLLLARRFLRIFGSLENAERLGKPHPSHVQPADRLPFPVKTPWKVVFGGQLSEEPAAISRQVRQLG